MAGFRRDKPIDPMHERGICLWLAEHHDRRVAETEGWERDDHQRAAAGCRKNAARWQEEVERLAAVADQPCKAKPVASHAQPSVQHKPKPKPAAAPPTVAGQGALF